LVGELGAPAPRQVAVEVELFLELERLVSRVRRARPLRVSAFSAAVCTTRHATYPLFIPRSFLRGKRGIPAPSLTTTHNFPPETVAELCSLNLFFGRGKELQIISRKHSVIGQ